jgi:hypothetical protein
MRDIWNPKYEWSQNPKYTGKSILNFKETGVIYNNSGSSDIQIALPDNIINDFYYVDNKIYLATNSGICILDISTNSGLTIIDTSYTPTEGSGLTSNIIYTITVDTLNDILYATTSNCIWKWNLITDKGWIIDETYIPVYGDSPPSGVTYNKCNIVHFRTPFNHDILYFGYETLGFWEWDVTIDKGKRLDMTTPVVFGDKLISNEIYQIAVDVKSELVYVATPLGVWRWRRTNNEGVILNAGYTPTTGDSYPVGNTRTVFYDNTYNILYVGFDNNGFWVLDTQYDMGTHYSTATPFTTNGVELPSDNVSKIYKDITNNTLYTTSLTNGTWTYNTGTGAGKIFNSISGVTYGNNLPSEIVSSFFVTGEYKLLYIGNELGLWKFNYEIEYYDALLGGEIIRTDREQLWNVENLTDVYFRIQKCISGVSFTYIDNLDDVYRFGVLTNDDADSLFNMYNEYEIMNKFIKNYIQVDVASTTNVDLTQPQFTIDGVILKENHLVLLKNQDNTYTNNIYKVNEKRYLILTDYLSTRNKSDRFKAYVKLGSTNKNLQYFLLPDANDVFPISGEAKIFDARHSYILKHRLCYDIDTIPTNTGNTHKLVFADYDVARHMNNKNFELYSGFTMSLGTLDTGQTFDIERYTKAYSIRFSNTYNPFDDYTKYTTDSIPAMTSYTCSSGTCSSNSFYASGYETWRAFDNNPSTNWRAFTTSGWIKFTYNVPIIIWKYSIECNDSPIRSPKNWIFQASNNDTDWVDLDTQITQIGWSARTYREYIIDNTVPYLYYRLYVTTNNGGSVLSISEIQLFNMIFNTGSTTYEPFISGIFKNVLIPDLYSKKYDTIIDNSIFSTIPVNIEDYIRIEVKKDDEPYLTFDTFIKNITTSGLTISDLIPEWVINDLNSKTDLTWIIRNIQYSDLTAGSLVVSLQNSFLSKFFNVNDVSTSGETLLLFEPREYEYNMEFDYDGLRFNYSGSTGMFETQNSYINYKLYEFLSGITNIIFTPNMILYNDDEITSFSQFYLDKNIIQLNVTNIDDLTNFKPYTYVEISGTTTYTKTLILNISGNTVLLEKPNSFTGIFPSGELVLKIKNIKELQTISELLYDVYKNEAYDYYIPKNDFIRKNIYLYYGEIMNENNYIKFYVLGLLSESLPNTKNFILRLYKIEDDDNLFYRPIEILDIGVDKKTMIPKQLLYPEYFNQTERIDDFYIGEYDVLDGNDILVWLVADPNDESDYIIDPDVILL